MADAEHIVAPLAAETVDGPMDFAAFEAAQKAPETAKEPEAPKAPEPEADAPQDATAADDGDAGDETEIDDGDEAEPKPDERNRSKPARIRIAELTKQARQAERDAAYWRGMAESGTKPQPSGDGVSPAPSSENPAPDPDKFEFGEADPGYIRELAKHEVRQEFAEQRRIDAETAAKAEMAAEIQRIESGWQEKTAAALERYPDFDEKVTATAERGEWPCPPIIALAIKASEVGHDVAYHLATNRAQAESIARMDPLEQARHFGRLEARYLDAAQKPQPGRIATDAPAPPQHRARGAAGRFAPDPATADFATFEKMERDARAA